MSNPPIAFAVVDTPKKVHNQKLSKYHFIVQAVKELPPGKSLCFSTDDFKDRRDPGGGIYTACSNEGMKVSILTDKVNGKMYVTRK